MLDAKTNPKGMGIFMRKEFKEIFNCIYRRDHLLLKDEYEVVRDEIVTFIDSKAKNCEEIKKGEIERLPHFNDLPCSLEAALEYDSWIEESFKAYIWALIQSGDIDVSTWDTFDDTVSSEISYLTYIEDE